MYRNQFSTDLTMSRLRGVAFGLVALVMAWSTPARAVQLYEVISAWERGDGEEKIKAAVNRDCSVFQISGEDEKVLIENKIPKHLIEWLRAPRTMKDGRCVGYGEESAVTKGYGTGGTFFGGGKVSLGYTKATTQVQQQTGGGAGNGEVSQYSIILEPFIGYFVAKDFDVSILFRGRFSGQDVKNVGDSSTKDLGAGFSLSYQIPFSKERSSFFYVGPHLGVGYSSLDSGVGYSGMLLFFGGHFGLRFAATESVGVQVGVDLEYDRGDLKGNGLNVTNNVFYTLFGLGLLLF